MKLLREKWGDDPDVIFLEQGVKFIGPKGRDETEEEHIQRLYHNSRMRFNRSFESQGFPKSLLIYCSQFLFSKTKGDGGLPS